MAGEFSGTFWGEIVFTAEAVERCPVWPEGRQGALRRDEAAGNGEVAGGSNRVATDS